MGLTLRLVIASVFIGRADAPVPSITVLGVVGGGGPPPSTSPDESRPLIAVAAAQACSSNQALRG